MRIIKNGKERVYQGECPKCHTIYEYSENDYFDLEQDEPSGIKRITTHFFKEDEEHSEIRRYKYKCLRCPVCGAIKKTMDLESIFKAPVVGYKKI